MLVEVKSGETYNGHLVSSDTWMNLNLREEHATRPTSRRRRNGLCVLGAVGVLATWNSEAFAQPASGALSSATGRRAALAGMLPALLGASSASAIPRVTDRQEYINRRKVELVPSFKQGIDYLERKGVDKRMELFLPKLARKMTIYASIQSASEVPDSTVRRLDKDIAEFRNAVEVKKDKDLALAAFEKYRLDIPKGVAYFDLKDPATYEAPPE